MVKDKSDPLGMEKKKSMVSYFDEEIDKKYLQAQQMFSEDKSNLLNIDDDNQMFINEESEFQKTKTGRK